MTIKCRPLYLPREINGIHLTAVYIAPDANASSALGLLHDTISNKQNKYPEAAHIISGDFNHADLKAVLPKFHQKHKVYNQGEKNTGQVVHKHQTGLQG